MRIFCIEADIPGNVSFVTSQDDTLGIIGNILSLVSQLDVQQSVVITCIDDE